MSEPAPLLRIDDLDVALPPGGDRAMAVERLTLDLRRGEILCVVGESGSGKSVLTRAILGDLPRGLRVTRGEITLGAERLTGLSPAGFRAIRGRRIALIPQEPMAALNPSTRVGRQIEEVLAIHTDLPRSARRARALELVTQMRLPDPPRILAAYPHQLSGGQCQRICIAMGLALDPEVLIADEPTTALDVTTQAQVLRLICEVRDRLGQTVLFITHDLGVVAEIADRVAVMQHGRLCEVGPARAVLSASSHPYTRQLIGAMPSFACVKRAVATHPRGAGPCVVVEGLTKRYGSTVALAATQLSVARASTLAVVGESGSGKSTLARLLVRLIEPTDGSAMIDGADFARLRGGPLRRARRQVQMIFQDPFGSLNPRRRIGPVIARAARLAGADASEAKRRARSLLELVGLDPLAYDRRPAAFSGGQRQRIGIARALAMDPQVLIADESVSALDVSVQAQILALLRDLQQRLGLTLIFITHDLRVAAQISDRIAVMCAGEIVEIGDAAQVLEAPSTDYTRRLLAAAPGRGVI